MIRVRNHIKSRIKNLKQLFFRWEIPVANNRVISIGDVFGRLEVTQVYVGLNSGGHSTHLCVCTCGTICKVATQPLRRGDTKSCGCFRKEMLAKFSATANSSHGYSSVTSSTKQASTYQSYHDMKVRCYNEKCPSYPRYGGKGIKVCERWLECFENFLEDMKEKPVDGWHIDRIDNDGNYEPGNCQWLSPSDNSKKANLERKLKNKSK